uniref:Ig-like domain-containing protein n=1 Tax=Paramormyrops kingsleyae TaxID=1676925 RepID=A0A3B3SYQ5_9TELE
FNVDNIKLMGAHSQSTLTHSMQYIYSASSGIPNFPEFVSVGLLDGEPMNYYDSKIRRMTPRQDWIPQAVDAAFWDRNTQNLMGAESVFKSGVEIIKPRFNQTGGKSPEIIHCTWQELHPTGARPCDPFPGLLSDALCRLHVNHLPYAPHQRLLSAQENADRAQLDYWKSYLTQTCTEWLKKYVSYGKSTLERTVRPEVSLLQKDPSSPVTCHTTDFFPKGIVVTWRKDGVDMHSDVEVGETLPNGDGTFQITSKLTMKPEDWKMNSYSCVVQHKSLQDDIVVLLEEKNIRTNQGSSWGIIIGCVAAALALVAVAVGVVLWRRSRTGNRKADRQREQWRPTETQVTCFKACNCTQSLYWCL